MKLSNSSRSIRHSASFPQNEKQNPLHEQSETNVA